MATTNNNKNDIIRWFKETKEQKLKVKGVEYNNIVGTDTGGGYYKNGFRTKILEGLKGKRKYLQIDIITSAGKKVEIEERLLFAIVADTFKIVKHTGWYNVNLLAVSRLQYGIKSMEYMDQLKAIYYRASN